MKTSLMLLLLLLSACTTSTPLGSTPAMPSQEAPSQEAPSQEASQDPAASLAGQKTLALLETLSVKGRSPKTGYNRKEKFGPAWPDLLRTGCDERNQVLKRDLKDVSLKNCKVVTGKLLDPYSNKMISFYKDNAPFAPDQDKDGTPGFSNAIQIDHVVALSDAWQKGAQSFSKDKRMLFANDLSNLLAVDGELNQQKSDSDAASWLPPNKAFRCQYVSLQVKVKAKYQLWVTKSEKDAMTAVLKSC